MEQTNGQGPTGRRLEGADRMPVMQFRVKDINVEDNSRVPDFLRTFPKVDLSEVVAEREWVFDRSEEHTSELQSLMRTSYAVFCLKKKNTKIEHTQLRIRHKYNMTD